MHSKILILDFGSQVTQLIARRVREAHVYCEIHPCDVSDEFVRNFGADGIILSGSHASVYEEETDKALEAVKASGKTEVYQPTEDEIKALQKALAPVHTEMADRIGKDLISSIYTATGFDPAK